MELDATNTSKNHESMPVSDKDRTSTAQIHLEFSGMEPKLFSQVVKNNSGNKKKRDRINVNGSGENGKATDESGWKVFSRKPITTIKRNDRISGKPELTRVISIESRRLIFKRDENISPTHGTGHRPSL
jgi:hypothetical protein